MSLFAVRATGPGSLGAAIAVLCVLAAGPLQAGGQSARPPAQDDWGWMADLTDSDAPGIERHYYKAFVKDSGALASEAVHMLKPVSPVGHVLYVDWRIHTEDLAGTEHALLDRHFGTINVKTTIPKRDTEYVIRRNTARLEFEGVHRGEPLDKTVDIDRNPFYTNPTIGLRGFVLSGDDKGRFWMLHPDNLKVYPIKARRDGVETVEVNNRRVEAVRVEWGLTGVRSLFYNRVFWFRASDGLFLKSDEADDIYTVWTGEKS